VASQLDLVPKPRSTDKTIELGMQGWDPLEISEMDIDSESEEDEGTQAESGESSSRKEKTTTTTTTTTATTTSEKFRCSSSNDHKNKNKNNFLFSEEGSKRVSFTDAPVYINDNRDYRNIKGDTQEHTQEEPIRMVNWIPPNKRNDSSNTIWPEGYLEEMLQSHINAIGSGVTRPRRSNQSTQQINKLFRPESEEEIKLIASGRELYRQRRAIPKGPVSVVARFGEIQLKDIAAIDEGATQSFVSKSWLYNYLKGGGNMKVVSFNSQGHQAFQGSCFYTYGVVEIAVYLQALREEPFLLQANVVKDSTAMYSVLLGANFIRNNNLFVNEVSGRLHLSEDLPQNFEVKGAQLNVNWSEPIADCYLTEDLVVTPNLQLSVVAILQEVHKRKKKAMKPSKVKEFSLDSSKTYAFVPKSMPNWSCLAAATSVCKPKLHQKGKECQDSREDCHRRSPMRGTQDEGYTDDSDSETNESVIDSDWECDLTQEEEEELMGYSQEGRSVTLEEGGGLGNTTSSTFTSPFSSTVSSLPANRKNQVTEGYQVPVQLINVGDDAAVLRAGTYLGQLHEVKKKEVPVQVSLRRQVQLL